MPPRLCADRMLMRLGRWLRFAGYDVLIPDEMVDTELIAAAAAHDALLLTRDRGICARRGVGALWVESEELEDQLEQVISEVGPPPHGGRMSRCSLCNSVLDDLEKSMLDDVEGGTDVPDRVRNEQPAFWYCGKCQKVYWRGSHYDKIMRTISLVTRT